MKTLTLLCLLVASLLSGCATKRLESNTLSSSDRLVGAWRLVSWTSTADGQTNHPYGPDGRMSVFLSRANRTAFARAEAKAGSAEEKVAAFDSCFAYAGTFTVAEGRVVHRLEQCTFPNWTGTEQVRFFSLDGDRLALVTPPLPTGDRQAVSRLEWEKLQP